MLQYSITYTCGNTQFTATGLSPLETIDILKRQINPLSSYINRIPCIAKCWIFSPDILGYREPRGWNGVAIFPSDNYPVEILQPGKEVRVVSNLSGTVVVKEAQTILGFVICQFIGYHEPLIWEEIASKDRYEGSEIL